MTETRTITLAPAAAGHRLDAALADALPDLSRARLQTLLRDGCVRRDGAVVSEGKRRVKGDETFEVRLPPPEALRLEPENRPLDIVYEDNDLLVLEKPAGLVVHPAPGHERGTLVHALLAHCGEGLSGIGGVKRPGIVHRIDKDVSGLLVVAKHDRAHLGLAGQFSVHSVERAYTAITYGTAPRRARVEKPIGRHPVDRKRMAVRPDGKRAVTEIERLETAGVLLSEVRCTLHTGRTHQIRVHLLSEGCPIVGDPLYRPRRVPRLPPALKAHVEGLERVFLHAHMLGFTHPVSGAALRFTSPPPPVFAATLELARA